MAGTTAAAALVPSRSASASEPADSPIEPAEPPTERDVQTFVDETLERTLAEHGAGGAVASVVHDGEIVALAGSGSDFFDDSTSADPEESPFRIGSIAKTITYTAAMQRIDRGGIDPHEDVTNHLECVSIREGDEPITLAHLATHTAGFDVGAFGIATDPDQLRPLADTLENPRPERLRPPGGVPSYTNYATGLTAQVVADETGCRFEEYVREEVFEPLEMSQSAFEPLSDEYLPNESGPDADAFASKVSHFSQVPPAGGMCSTAADVGQFIRAVLGDGSTDGGRILSPDAADALLEQWGTPHDALEGVGFGFWRQRRGETVVVGHGGGIGSFRGDLLLVPELDLGLFVASHSEQGVNAYQALDSFVEAFLDRFVPVEAPDIPPTGNADPDHAGAYLDPTLLESDRYNTVLGLGDAPPERLEIDADGFLMTGGDDHRWLEVDSGVYRRADGAERLAIREIDGETYLFRGSSPTTGYRKVATHERPTVHAALLGASLLVVVSGAVGWPVAAGWRRYHGDDTDPSSPKSWTRARAVVGGAVSFLALFGVGAAVLVATGGIFSPPTWLPAVLAIPALAAITTVLAVGFAARAWWDGHWSRSRRLHYTAVVCALVVVAWVLYRWNLLFGSY
ncbi:serine hydrolase domain-containing protein [Natrarchaeobius sp. A-rgal3]|uniref:serine hydrolase domain-containing protein n=1 Tax=Natrarchaeobius versutus TaxID=1679078 RepID=UPI00350EAABD